MADLKSFSQRIILRGANLEEDVNRLVRKVALLVDTAVVLGTPVATGRARANWQVSIGDPAPGSLPAPASPGQAAQEAIQQAQSAVASYNGGDGVAIHITNNLPYIKRLNEGWSQQAPAGFVEKAIKSGAAAVRAGLTTDNGKGS